MFTLEIENFKCFHGLQQVPVNRLTVLVGCNSSGKSSVVQALRYLHRARHAEGGVISLVEDDDQGVGSTTDLINEDFAGSQFSIELFDEDNGSHVSALFSPTADDAGLEFSFNCSGPVPELMAKELYFLSAERVGPRISSQTRELAFTHCGKNGEATAQVLLRNELNTIEPERVHPGIPNRLMPNVRAWLNYILPSTDIAVIGNEEMQRAKILAGHGRRDMRTSASVGFGVSYVLPIIVDCLVAVRGRLILIENPEAHLHPAAQTRMGLFLARMAMTGLNIVVETHSEHILEGIQVFAAEHPDTRNLITVNFFRESDSDEGEGCKVMPIYLERDFSFSEFPKGFLDESVNTYKAFQDAKKKAAE